LCGERAKTLDFSLLPPKTESWTKFWMTWQGQSQCYAWFKGTSDAEKPRSLFSLCSPSLAERGKAH
jgi:hypothetical protein